MVRAKKGFSLKVLVSAAIVVSMVLLSLVIIGQSYGNNRQALIRAVQIEAQNIADSIGLKIEGYSQNVSSTIQLLEFDPLTSSFNHTKEPTI